jgi:hypothetical protein
MKAKLTPEDLQNDPQFQLLKEVSHQNLREFIMEQIREEKLIIRYYSIYQIIMMSIFVFILTRNIILSVKGNSDPLFYLGLAILFSFSLLIVVHELIHALAYLITGSQKISFGFILKKFVFYALADRQVVSSKPFHFVALAPFVLVKLICLLGVALFFNSPVGSFFLTIMCLHSLFCAGDIAMLAFYRMNSEKEIYNFDVRSEGKTYFYVRKIN